MSDPKPPPTTTTTTTPQNKPSQPSATNKSYSGQIKTPNPYPNLNPPDLTNPDPATLRDQWRYAVRQYSRWYSQAWGSAILAGISFFALGWIIKGENPLPSFHSHDDSSSQATKKIAEQQQQKEA